MKYKVAVGVAIAGLKKQSKPVTTLEVIAQVAIISAHEDIKMETSFFMQ